MFRSRFFAARFFRARMFRRQAGAWYFAARFFRSRFFHARFWGPAGLGDEPLQPPVAVPAGGRIHFLIPRPRLVEGDAVAVLPPLRASARGVVGVAGRAVARLPQLHGTAVGTQVVLAEASGRLLVRAIGAGDVGTDGTAIIRVGFVGRTRGTVGRSGNARGMISISARGHGMHDPDEPAIIAALLAA